MDWFSKYTPGFTCVGRKPNPFGNERNSICCGLTSIFCISHIVEGRYHPQHIGQKKYKKLGKTESLMLRMCRPILG